MKGKMNSKVILIIVLIMLIVASAIIFAVFKWGGKSFLTFNKMDNSTTESNVSDEGSLEVPLKIDDAHIIVVKCPKGYQDFMSDEYSASFIKENIKYKVSMGNENLESAKENITSTINYMKDNTDSIIGEPIIGEEMKYKDYDAHYSLLSQKIDGEFLYTHIIHIDIGAKYTVEATLEAPEEMKKEEMLNLIEFSVK